MTDWLNGDWRTDGLMNQRNRWTDRPMDGLTTDELTDLDWWSDRWMNDRNLLWLTGHVWLLKSPWLTKMTYYLTYSLAYWLTGWMINPTSSGRNNFVPLIILLKDRLKKVAWVWYALLNFSSNSPYALGMLEWEPRLQQLALDPCRRLMLFGWYVTWFKSILLLMEKISSIGNKGPLHIFVRFFQYAKNPTAQSPRQVLPW